MKGVNLQNVTEFRDLGVIVDSKCLFKQHISVVSVGYRLELEFTQSLSSSLVFMRVRGRPDRARALVEAVLPMVEKGALEELDPASMKPGGRCTNDRIGSRRIIPVSFSLVVENEQSIKLT